MNQFSRDIAAGRRRAVLVSGAEAIYSLYNHSRGKTALDWPDNETLRQLKERHLYANFDTLLHLGCDNEKSILDKQGRKYDEPNNRVEEAYDLFMPQFMYPFFEPTSHGKYPGTPEEPCWRAKRKEGKFSMNFFDVARKSSYVFGFISLKEISGCKSG